MALTDQLVAYYKLDEVSGTRFDSVGTNHLTDINTVASTTGKQGNAALFVTANSERLECVDSAALSLGANDLSVAAWVYFTAFPTAYWVAKYEGSQYEYILQYTGSGVDRLYFTVYMSSGPAQVAADSLGAPALNTWYFVVGRFTLSTRTSSIVVNDGGVNYSTPPGPGTTYDSTAAFAVGAIGGGGGTVSGQIDEVGVWKRVLTPSEITQLYNGGAGMSITLQSQAPRSMHRRRLAAV